MSRAPQYSFPMLSPEETVSCLVELQIPVTVDDLLKPKAATAKRIYEGLIEHCTGTTQEELSQPKASALFALPNYALHEDSIPVIMTLRALSELLSTCGVSSFGSMRDLMKPDPKRLLRNLSAIINFAKYREERVGVYTDLTSRTDELKELRMKKLAEKEELMQKVEAARAKRASAQPAIDALTAECAEHEAKIDTLNKRQAVLKHETNELKAANNDARDKLSSAQFEILGCEERITKLNSQIVNSPARLRTELKTLATQLEDDRAGVDDVERKRRATQARLEGVKQAERDIEGVSAQLNEVGEEYNMYKDVVREVRTKKSAIQECEGDMGTIEAQKKHLNAKIKKLTEKIEAFRPDSELKASVSKEAVEDAQRDLDTLQSELAAARKARAEAKARKAAIEETVNAENAAHCAEMEAMKKAFNGLRVEVSGYHRRLLGSITNQQASDIGMTA